MSSMIERARALRREATCAERLLWMCLRGKSVAGFRFRRQVPLGGIVVDFACLAARLVVEVEGAEPTPAAEIARRDAWLHAENFNVLRVTEDELFRDRRKVLAAIRRELLALRRREAPGP